MKRPRRAIVLAAGFGSRLAPLTLDCPKPLLPLKGIPLIQRVLLQLAEWGVTDVAVNLHHRADMLVEQLPGLCPNGMRLTLSFEPEILGTGGALQRLSSFWEDDPFWLCNADVVQELNPKPLLKVFEEEHPLAALWMIPDHGPRTVQVEQQKVIDFRGGGMTFSGLHLISSRLREYLPREVGFSSVIDLYEQAMASGETVSGVVVPGSRWEDAGTPERILKLEEGSLVCPGARIDRDVQLENALVGPGVRIRGRRKVQGMVVQPAHFAPFPKGYTEAEAVEILEARGSDRSYLRVHLPDRSVICARSGEARPENLRTAGHFRFLEKQGIRVPQIEWVSRDGREIWMEDVGREDVLQRIQTGSERRNQSDLKKCLQVVARFHEVRVPSRMSLEPAFSRKLYEWEHDLFVNEFLKRHDPETDPAPLRKELRQTARRLHQMPQVLLHRDLQSTNLLWFKGEPVMIDVQGMRKGPVGYDLGSFLADPYVDRSKEAQLAALKMYQEFSDHVVTEEDLALGATQRLVQALGAYGRLGAMPGTRRFLDHIPAAVRQLSAWAVSSELKSWAKTFSMRHFP